jgi:hypothetical protein
MLPLVHHPLNIRNRLICVVRLAVREQVVNQHADDGEQEHDKRPEHLVRHGAVRLEDLNCDTLALPLYYCMESPRGKCNVDGTYSKQ